MNAPGIFEDIFETPAEVMFGFEKNGEDVGPGVDSAAWSYSTFWT